VTHVVPTPAQQLVAVARGKLLPPADRWCAM